MGPLSTPLLPTNLCGTKIVPTTEYSRIPTFASVLPLDIVYIQLLLYIIRHLPPSQTTLNNLWMTYYESRLRIMTTIRNALIQAYSFAYGIFMCIVVSNIIIYNVLILSDE